MLINMIKNNFNIKFFFLLLVFFNSTFFAYSQVMILSECKNLKDGFVKNEYILDLENSLIQQLGRLKNSPSLCSNILENSKNKVKQFDFPKIYNK